MAHEGDGQLLDRLRSRIRERQRPAPRRFSPASLAESGKIVGICVLAATGYGIVHDQVTVRVCLEYFTVGHPPIFQPHSPTLLALGWGVLATWWVGMILGVPLAFISRFGTKPKLRAADLWRPVAILLTVMGVSSLVCGCLGYAGARMGWLWLAGPVASRVPVGNHNAYLADLWAHSGAYCGGFLGGVVIWFHAWHRRRVSAGDRVHEHEQLLRN